MHLPSLFFNFKLWLKAATLWYVGKIHYRIWLSCWWKERNGWKYTQAQISSFRELSVNQTEFETEWAGVL